MNIRSLTTSLAIVPPTKLGETADVLKSHDTTERDADGRQPFGEKKCKLSPEEIDKMIASLRSHPGVIEHQLTIELIGEENARILTIATPDGQIIRRVPEDDFYQFLGNIDQTNGRLFNRAA